jgi:hypothetical protein
MRLPNNGVVINAFNALNDSAFRIDALQSFAIALGYLYASTSIALVSLANARSVLATACLLGGMDELCAYAYELCKNSISVESIDDWLDFLQTLSPPPSASGSGAVSPATGVAPGLQPLPPNLHELRHTQFGVGAPPTNGVLPPSSSSSVFGPYGPRLRDDVFQFLVSTLPEQLAAANPGESAAITSALVDVYVRLPFEYFKAAVESPDFPIGARRWFLCFVLSSAWRGFASARLFFSC